MRAITKNLKILQGKLISNCTTNYAITGKPYTKQNFLAKSKATVNRCTHDGSPYKPIAIKDTDLQDDNFFSLNCN